MAEQIGEAFTIECANPECKKQFVVTVPQGEVVNSFTLSMVVWAHPDAQPCPHCGTGYQMRLKGIGQPAVGFIPVRQRSDASVIVPPAGMKLPPPPGGGNGGLQ